MWLPLVLVGYFFNAVAAVVDKFLITKKITNPAVYVFFISILGLLALVLAPWGWYWPGGWAVWLAVVAGATFTYGLLFMFKALAIGDASRVMPAVGGLTPLFVFIFSFLLVGERLANKELLAFALIVLGTVVIAWERKTRSSKKVALQALVSNIIFSGALYGVSYALTKLVFDSQGFICGFIWIRLGAVAGALILLLTHANRLAIKESLSESNGKTGGLFLFGQSCGALSGVLVNYAIALGSVTLINALQGVQYVFLLLIVLLLARRHPRLLTEKLTGAVLVQKIVATALIIFGLVIIA